MGDKPGRKSRKAKGLRADEIDELPVGRWIAYPSTRGAGRLQARKLANGTIAWYFRYTAPDGERVRLPLRAGMTLSQAKTEADKLSIRYRSGERDLRGALLAEEAEKRRIEAEKERAEAEKAHRAAATLGALLNAYWAQMERDGRTSASRVRRAVKLHVEDAWPQLWKMPAHDVTPDDLLAVVARLVDSDKLREAAKLRSYLSAAYAAGIRARQDARSIAALRDLGISSNPARDLVAIEGSSNARDRALSIAELHAYWKRITALPDPDGALLRFHLLTGGQRVEQLARLTLANVDHDTKTMRLEDSKGRRRRPRIHVVPLIPEAIQALKAMRGGEHGEFAFTATGGLRGAAYHVVQHRLRQVVDAMVKAEEAEPFTAGDLRRTIETRLAAEGVSQDIRAQLQSHGLGGIQARHYDRHSYEPEKRAALETLHRILTGNSAKVSTLTGRKRSRASG